VYKCEKPVFTVVFITFTRTNQEKKIVISQIWFYISLIIYVRRYQRIVSKSPYTYLSLTQHIIRDE